MGTFVKLLTDDYYEHLKQGEVYILKGNSLFNRNNEFLAIVKAEDIINNFKRCYFETEAHAIKLELIKVMEQHRLSRTFVADSLNVNYNNLLTWLSGSRKTFSNAKVEKFKEFIEKYNDTNGDKE